MMMKYMGSKNRIAKHILPIILRYRKEGQWYVEPFVGGANMIDKVGGNRLGADSHSLLIEALVLIRDDPQSIPDLITEGDYQTHKNGWIPDSGLRGFVGFAMSFGGKWFGGYRRDVKGTKGCIENMKTQTRRSKQSAIKQSANIQGVKFIDSSAFDLDVPSQSIIYCDPPYEGTTKYKDDFDHVEFWQKCRDWCADGHQVFISEYNAPNDFICVWAKEISVNVAKNNNGKKGVEKLFIHSSQLLIS